MSTTIEASYGKKLGLPNYSSHHFSLSVRTEVDNVGALATESLRLYELLQGAVDRALERAGVCVEALEQLPAEMPEGRVEKHNGATGESERWQCSDRQRNLILAIIEEQRLNHDHVEWLAQERFGKSLKGLSRLEASSIITKLLTR